MVDTVDKSTRSRIMSRVHSKDTGPEMIVRRGLFSRGFRYRLHCRKLPGKPDLVFPKYKSVIFVNGCFWHGHNCQRFRLPASNRDYWLHKIERNRTNDVRNADALRLMGWKSLIVWECDITGNSQNREAALDAIAEWISVSAE
jgi:DNA mismatch endonuclease (patch repair protein)